LSANYGFETTPVNREFSPRKQRAFAKEGDNQLTLARLISPSFLTLLSSLNRSGGMFDGKAHIRPAKGQDGYSGFAHDLNDQTFGSLAAWVP
jgi:hypothetical protein